jgi:hypothetical protein
MSRINDVVANYEEERGYYLTLLTDAPPVRILLFQGESGSGKTTLLDHCLHDFDYSDRICRVIIDFKGGRINLPKLFNELGREIGWKQLPTFQTRLANFAEGDRIAIDQNRQIGLGNRITVFLSPEDPTVRIRRLAALSEDLLTDLLNLTRPVLIVLDTYEQATAATREWIETYLLDWLDKVVQLRVLIAGQTIPEPTLKWGRLSQIRQLHGVPEPDHWVPVVERISPQHAGKEHRGWLNAICQTYEGRPNEIMKIIEALG